MTVLPCFRWAIVHVALIDDGTLRLMSESDPSVFHSYIRLIVFHKTNILFVLFIPDFIYICFIKIRTKLQLHQSNEETIG